MKKQSHTTSEDRKMKFAEAGILFALVLAVTVFVGVRLVNHNSPEDIVEVAQVTEAPTIQISEAAPAITEASADIVADSTVEATIVEADETLAATPPRIVTYAMAEQTYFDGDYTEAAAMFDAYTADHNENAWGYFMLGLSEWKAGDLDASEEAFIAALELKPDHVKSLVNYSRVLVEQERPNDARIQIELALQAAPENVDANRMFSRLAHNEGQLDAAADSYLKVLQIKADDVWSLNNLGLIRIEQERFADALAPLAKAAQLSTGIACIQNNLGVALERTGHYIAAAEAFEMALAADDSYAKADESLDRVAGLTEVDDLDAIDLIALADSFDAHPTVAMVETSDEEVMEVPGDMEVATTLSETEVPDAPQNQ